MTKKKEPTKLILLDSHKIFLSLQFLLNEEKECLTPYGEGLLRGLLDPDCGHKMAVVPREEYEKLLNKKPKKRKPSFIKKKKKGWKERLMFINK